MPKFLARLFLFSLLATSLLAVPIITQASAATTSHKHAKKKTVATHQSPRDTGTNPFASKYEDDFDRKNASGGGGY